MPFKSKAQRKWMYWAEAHGKVPKGTSARWEKHTKNKKLPKKVGRKNKKLAKFLKKTNKV